MTETWTKRQFADLCDIVRGGSPRPIHDWLAPTGVPWVKISDATSAAGRTISSTQDFIRPEGKSRSRIVYPGDLILSNSATPGIPKFMGLEACIHDGWLLLRNFRGLDKDYAYYLLLNERPKLVSQGNGSVFTNLKTEILKRHTVSLPGLEYQKRVSSLLKILDDKIELNRRTNETLESMAQATFRDWFVDFGPVRRKLEGASDAVAVMGGLTPDSERAAALAALFPDTLAEDGLPKGWSRKRLEDLCELAYGKSLPSTSRRTGAVPVYGSGGKTGHHDQPLVEGPGIVVGRKGTVGALYWEPGPFFPIDTVFYVRPRGGASLEYLWALLPTLGLAGMNTDAAVPGLNRENAYRLEVAWGGAEVANALTRLLEPIRKKMDQAEAENCTLAETRDYLLPRLLSGKVQVSVSKGRDQR